MSLEVVARLSRLNEEAGLSRIPAERRSRSINLLGEWNWKIYCHESGSNLYDFHGLVQGTNDL